MPGEKAAESGDAGGDVQADGPILGKEFDGFGVGVVLAEIENKLAILGREFSEEIDSFHGVGIGVGIQRLVQPHKPKSEATEVGNGFS